MKVVLYALASILCTAGVSRAVKHFWRGSSIPQAQVEKRWGASSFNPKKFKSGSVDIRAAMASSLLKRKSDFVGKDALDVRKELGDFDGFYFRDSFPTYVIHSSRGEGDSTVQIVFLLDGNFKVGDVFIHEQSH